MLAIRQKVKLDYAKTEYANCLETWNLIYVKSYNLIYMHRLGESRLTKKLFVFVIFDVIF